MPSGRIHDRITLWCFPFVVWLAFWATRSPVLTLITALSFLVGGFMLGPDLDIHSVQYKRWGLIRWIWIPYQTMLKHRSRLSHGPIIGTALRVVYLSGWIALFTIGLIEGLNGWWNAQLTWQGLRPSFHALLNRYLVEWLAILIGLELGSISHSASDVVGSYFVRKKRHKRSAAHKKRRS